MAVSKYIHVIKLSYNIIYISIQILICTPRVKNSKIKIICISLFLKEIFEETDL